MNAKMNTNSLFAFQSLLVEGKINNQQKQILELLKDGISRSSRQIAKSLGMERTSVTGRITKLKELSVLDFKNDTCPTTSKSVEFYTVVGL